MNYLPSPHHAPSHHITEQRLKHLKNELFYYHAYYFSTMIFAQVDQAPSPSETPTPPKPTFDIVSKTPKPSPKPTFPIVSKTAPPTNVPIEPDVKPKPTPSLVDNDTPGHWPTTPKPTFGIDVDVATRDPALPDIATLAPVPGNDATLKPVPDITDINGSLDGPN